MLALGIIFVGGLLGGQAGPAGTLDPRASLQTDSATTAAPTQLEILVGRHERIQFDRDVNRVAVATSDTVTAVLIHSRELLVTAGAPGITAVTVWFDDAEPEEFTVSVVRDLSILRQLLTSIDPLIEAEYIPARDLVILRGTVEDPGIREAAATTAEAFVQSNAGSAVSPPTLLEGAEGEVALANPGQGLSQSNRSSGSVVNLLRVTALPSFLEERIAEAIEPLAGGTVTVRRIQTGTYPNDDEDVFHLEGTVPDQVSLTRLLFVASRAVRGPSGGGQNSDIRVLADESGALTQARNIFGSGGGQQGGGQQGGGLGTGNGNAALSGGGSNNGNQLANRIGAQVARAKAVEAAGGRILSTIQVEHLPFVRVDLRLYEVNTTKLRSWRNDLTVAGSDFDQPALLSPPESIGLQGANAPNVGDGDVLGLLEFLNGTLSGRDQLVSGGFALDNLFQVLVQEEVARSISHPSLAVLSGELAQFQVGGQIPVPVALTVGGGTDQVLNSVEFRDFGINLTVRPLVEERSSSRITLDVTPSITLPDLALTAAIGNATGQTAATTAFESRATQTSARVYDGESVVIGGLTTSLSQDAQNRAPLLGSVPVLGWLFRNEAETRDETELVIIVTASVVREPSPEALLWSFPSTDGVLRRCLDRVSAGPWPTDSSSDTEPSSYGGL